MRPRFRIALAAWIVVGGVALSASQVAGAEGEVAVAVDRADAPPGAGESWLDLVDFRAVWGHDVLSVWMARLLPAVAILLGLALGRLAAWQLGVLARRCERRGWTVQKQVLTGLVSPANVALFAAGLAVAVANIDALETSRPFWERVLLLLVCLAVLWYASNLVFAVELLLGRLTAGMESAVDRSLGPLVRKSLRVILWSTGALFILNSVFDQDIGALLAGLGIAGLAVSLAAQDSLKNLFGSVTIVLDRPFQVGERIIYSGYDGMIEEIGLRSTKLRTLTGHLVTIPNAKIVNDPVENVGQRPTIRRTMNVTITYDTPLEKIREAVGILRGILEEDELRGPIHPVVNGDELAPRVYFNDYNAESLNVFVIYWYAPPAYWDYLEHAERLNLRIFEEFEKAGIEFAFPTQTIYLAHDAKRQLVVEMLGKGMEGPG
jgi:MscS family membrane protein